MLRDFVCSACLYKYNNDGNNVNYVGHNWTWTDTWITLGTLGAVAVVFVALWFYFSWQDRKK